MLYIFTILLFWGCTQNAKESEKNNSLPIEVTSIKTEEKKLENKYNEYLLLMNESDRNEFLNFKNDSEREKFLQLYGCEQQKYLNEHLKLEMSSQQVRDFLGNPIIQETSFFKEYQESRWTYSFFNGYSTINYFIYFKDDKLVLWGVL